MVGARIKPMFEEEARARQFSTLKQNAVPANLPERSKGEAREKAAEAVNVSPRTVESASRVLEKGSPELVQAVESGRASVSAAARLITPEQTEHGSAIDERMHGADNSPDLSQLHADEVV